MRAEAEAVVRRGAPSAPLVESWTADMRYRGQGHEVTVPIPAGEFTAAGRADLARLFEAQYAAQFGRNIPGLDVEVLSWALRLAAVGAGSRALPAVTAGPRREAAAAVAASPTPPPANLSTCRSTPAPHLPPAICSSGPALIIEDETTTVVTAGFTARINGLGYIVLTRTEP